MRTSVCFSILIFATISLVAEARSYVPIGAMQPFGVSNQIQYRQVNVEARPSLPDIRSAELELLQDALINFKMTRKVTSRAKANETIISYYQREDMRPKLRGIMAEALFLHDNPHWGYVRSPTAQQCDVYSHTVAGKFVCAQIKTHVSGNPATYTKDMESDWRAKHFLIPDDDAVTTKAYLRNQISILKSVGNQNQITTAQIKHARVGGFGHSSKELDNSLFLAYKHAQHETVVRENKIAYSGRTYVSLGAGLAMAVGPALSDWLLTGSLNRPTAQQTAHAGAIFATERATTYALGKIGTGALQGGFRGNAITGIAVLITDTSFSIYEYGGAQAFQNVGFFTQLGGGVGALALGLSTGTLVASTISPYNPIIGAATGFFTGSTVGFAGYIFGQSATRKILEVTNPDFFHKAEDTAISDAQKNISAQIVAIVGNKQKSPTY